MLYTITVNPTVDITNELKLGDQVTAETHRPKDQLRHAGGKGIDVSRVIRNLGGQSVAMGFLGGFTGSLVEGLLLQDGLELDFVGIRDETRTNVIIMVQDPADKNRTLDYRFNSPGPKVQPFEFLELCKKVRALANSSKEKMPTYAAICGSLCKEMKAASYVGLVRYFKDMHSVVALDTSEEALKETLRYAPRPDIIKPNVDEFYDLMASKPPREGKSAAGCGIDSKGRTNTPTTFWKDLFEQIARFRRKYPGVNALITLGDMGMVLLQDNHLSHARLCPGVHVKVRSSVGAGDSALAGLLFELDRGRLWADALRTALAAATAAVLLPGTESPTKENVEKFMGRVEIHEHEFPSTDTPKQPNQHAVRRAFKQKTGIGPARNNRKSHSKFKSSVTAK
ncbi:MAG: PfkB family carbohydrate kinase [Verrucomicrobiota bacterium]|jgi:6-phosphofructokinase 2